MLEPEEFTQLLDFCHGSIATRKCTWITDLSLIEKPPLWKSQSAIIRIESERQIRSSVNTQTETRYYMSSKCAGANQIQKAIRSHWGIENKVHWSLHVAFIEDGYRKKAGITASNLYLINRLALNLLKKRNPSISLKAKDCWLVGLRRVFFKVLNL